MKTAFSYVGSSFNSLFSRSTIDNTINAAHENVAVKPLPKSTFDEFLEYIDMKGAAKSYAQNAILVTTNVVSIAAMLMYRYKLVDETAAKTMYQERLHKKNDDIRTYVAKHVESMYDNMTRTSTYKSPKPFNGEYVITKPRANSAEF